MTCSKCNATGNHHYSYKRKRADGTKYLYRSTICAPCTLDRNKEYLTEGKRKKYNSSKKESRRKRKLRAIKYKGSKCQSCGGSFHQAAMDFHHRDPNEKDMDPGLMMQLSDEVLFKELDKCDLLCSNCHRILHYENGSLGTRKK